MNFFPIIFMLGLLSACTMGPDYVKPTVDVPEKYKEADGDWKIAQPQDDINKGPWWEIFKPELWIKF